MVKSHERVAVFIFGVVFVVAMLIVAVFFPKPTTFQYAIFRVVLALAAAGVAAMLPGSFDLHLASWLKAGGALGVFAAVLFKSPAELVSQPPPPPITGSTVVLDGFSHYDESGFNFAMRKIVPWNGNVNGKPPDILVAKPPGEAKPQFFLSHETGDYKHPELDKGAYSGIQSMDGASLKDVKECPSDGYSYHWFKPLPNGLYCVVTHDGKHYAVLRVDAIDEDRIGFDYAYQADGTRTFGASPE
ncbi:hypothetical protein [Caballeronia calidae]|nr:hypothetical protein [Caballeronia calidae]